ncbi:MAG: response regulator [Bacteroidia bacterium]|nr:response regulator [Bacteroidia bacterium]
MHLVQRNSDRMLKLVGQLTDLNKLDHGKMVLNVKACDISAIIRSAYEAFGNAAERKEIAFRLDCPDYLLCWTDSDKFEKVVYNLLSNAFKYTPSGGSVTLRAGTGNAADVGGLFPEQNPKEGNYLIVSVSDTGIGIPDDRKKDIFTRFMRITPDSRTGGTGIGLSFSKSLVEIHRGMIGVKDGKAGDGSASGSVFFFALPADSSAYTPEELSGAESPRQNTVDGSIYKSEYTLHKTPAATGEKRTKVLVIDDDSEILYYLSLVLSEEYEVITRSDAVSGYKKIEEVQPDVIISDIMMVEMDGLKLCRMVKDDIGISHIPFILLTAKTTTDDQIEGMNAGADAYIVKPFDPGYLKAVIASLLRNRDNVRKALGASTSIDKVEVEENVISAQDKKLLEKIYAIMEDSLMDSELNISEMTVNLGMSRTKLYYKIKGLTGQTPNEFFKTFKLNKAAEMIKEGKYKISAIADMVGFSSPSHFAAAFQKQFGKLPSKY